MIPGLYEQIIDTDLDAKLKAYPENCQLVEELDSAEAGTALTQYISAIVQQSMNELAEGKNPKEAQVNLTNQILKLLHENGNDRADAVQEGANQLKAILAEDDPRVTASGMKAKDVVRPETSIAMSSLFTGAVHEPQMLSELKKEIATADSVDMLVSFIKWSGLRQIIDELRTLTEDGKRLRVITTSYMGATDVKAIEELAKLKNTELRVSYDTQRTRLHAKSYVFDRKTGFKTAYVGSSNLSNAAITAGLEWNVKVTAKDQPEIIKKIDATFEAYWNSSDFEVYNQGDSERLRKALLAERYREKEGVNPFILDIQPYPYQAEILERLKAERELRGHYRNLVVAATGTGKTVISAFDYLRYQRAHQGERCRLLFVAHREELLKQALYTFQYVLHDPNFGELYVGGANPVDKNHMFASVGSINSRDLCENLPEDFYDFIIVDEFHHAAAPSYQALLTHFKPKILLGLTATPERMDGQDILQYFDGRIAADIRLPEAIDRKLLCPFQYFGVSDTVDLNEVRWVRGGYDRNELSKIYSMSGAIAERRADHVIRQMQNYVTDMNEVKAIGFCVSIEHANFMADYFNEHGIKSLALSSHSSDVERNTAKARLESGEIKVLFVVDLYNEGVDIKPVNTVLFLRPTESLTVFLQQLGRGLRLYPGKECLTVLDFVGLANRNYNFEAKFRSLLEYTRHSVAYELEHGFVSVPKGCYISLEKKAAQVILENLKKSFGNKAGLLMRIEDCKEVLGHVPSVSEFLEYAHIGPEIVYARYNYSRLLVDAGMIEDFDEPLEKQLTSAFPRLVAIDSRNWMEFLLDFLQNPSMESLNRLSETQRRYFNMFYVTVFPSSVPEWNGKEMRENWNKLLESPNLLKELKEILQYSYERIDLISTEANLPYECPLEVHCSYTRDQLLVALDYMTPGNVREGVKWLPEKQTDVLMVTLNKSDKDYSPSTMYDDYSVNDHLFHWQSQSTTSDTSTTGMRYRNHKKDGSQVCLFVREYKKDALGTAPYVFMGKCSYHSHNGSKPMNVLWDLEAPIPAKYLKVTNKLVG